MVFTIFHAWLLVGILSPENREGGGDLPHAVGAPRYRKLGNYCGGIGGGNPRLRACGFGSA